MAESQKPLVQISDEDFASLTDLRNVLDQNAQESVQKASPYMAGVFTELLSQVEKELARVNKFSGRMKVAAMRRKVKQLRAGTNGTNAPKSKSQSA